MSGSALTEQPEVQITWRDWELVTRKGGTV